MWRVYISRTSNCITSLPSWKESSRIVYLPRRLSIVLPQFSWSLLPSLFTDLLVLSSSGKLGLCRVSKLGNGTSKREAQGRRPVHLLWHEMSVTIPIPKYFMLTLYFDYWITNYTCRSQCTPTWNKTKGHDFVWPVYLSFLGSSLIPQTAAA